MMAMMKRSVLLKASKVFPLPGYQTPGAQDDEREATQPLCRMKHHHYVASQSDDDGDDGDHHDEVASHYAEA